MTLAAAETYTGTTTVTGGILRLAGGSRLAGGALAVTGGGVDLNGQTQTVGALSGGAGGAITLGGGTLTVDQAGDSTFGGVLSGAGSLIKTGSGRLTLTGTNSASGGVAVDGGTLAVGDAANPGASIASATVAAGATLTGTGTIGGDVANAGILAPSGTLAIGGSYRQASSGRLVIEVSPSTASQVRLGGAAHLAGTLTLAYDPGVYTTRRYTIVEAASVDGGFGTITGTAPAGTRQTLGYSANAVTLPLTGATTTVAPTVTGVVPAIGIAMLTNGQSANTLLFSHLAERRGGSGTDTATPSLAQLAFAGDDRDLGQILAGLPQAVAALGGWMRVTGGTGSVDGATGYGTSGGGFLAGVDRQATEHLIVGVAAGYSRNRLYAHDGGHGTLDSPRLSVYGSYGLDPRWSADASLGYAFDSISSRRATALGIAGASHSGHEGSAQAELRGTLPAATVDLIPTVGVRYVVLAEQGYSESGALGNDLTVASALHQSAQPFAGLAVTRRFTADDGTRWTPEAALEAARELVPSGAAALTAGNGAFTASPTAPSRDRLTAGLALDVSQDGSLAGRIAYQALLPTGNAVTHTVSAGLRYQF
ncbi:MAG: autotransporter domain-containing protein [Telmatospirillum sp.]|nr:autotransporter domain-containing protein [Telmatospirillum sp.]